MRLPLLACALLTACAQELPDGVTIAVEPMDGVATVELFLGDRTGGGLSGAPDSTPESAELYEVAHANEGPWIVTLAKDEAFSLLNDTDEQMKIHMLAAVGYNAAGEPIAAYRQRDVYIEPGMTDFWTLVLSPATPIIPGDDAGDGEFRARAWKRDGMPSCVQIEHGHELYAFGPIGDRDCDQISTTEDTECAPWVHRAEGVPPAGGFSSATCGASVIKQQGFPNACLAGGRTCNEVMPTNDTTCTPLAQDYCVPTDLCQCPTWDLTCVRTKLTVPPLTSYVSCHVCSTHVDFTELRLAPILGASTSTCNDVRLREVSANAGGLDANANFTTGELKITGRTECAITMEWNGMPAANPDLALLSLDLDNGNHVVVPLYVEYSASCVPAEQACTTVASSLAADPARWCAEPPTATMCGGDAVCDGGVFCGDGCCRPGERCDAGVCMCGNNYGGCDADTTCEAGSPSGSNACGTECCGGTTGVPCTL